MEQKLSVEPIGDPPGVWVDWMEDQPAGAQFGPQQVDIVSDRAVRQFSGGGDDGGAQTGAWKNEYKNNYKIK